MKKSSILGYAIIVGLAVTAIIGEVNCIIKMVKCDWNPIGKAEVLYTIGSFTPLGSVIGYLDIEDSKSEHLK